MRRQTLYFVYGVALLFAFGSGFFLSNYYSSKPVESIAIREHDERYEFIRPLLICQINEQSEDKEFKSLEQTTEGIVARAAAEGRAASVSVYFRDLNSGRWMGIKELEQHAPASLLKVPIMMAYLKAAEDSRDILEKWLFYSANPNDRNSLITTPLLISGQGYTIDDLIRGMIIQSDNSAKDILEGHADPDILAKTYAVLDIASPYLNDDEYKISAKSFALFFRVLYNGTYLNREMSNYALSLLSKAEFDLGLRAGTPEDISIAHKFGSRINETVDGSKTVELSDCGIVYEPSSPYLICVMAKGENPYILAEVISEIASAAYKAQKVGN